MRSSVTKSAGPIHLGMDTSKNKIAVGILRWAEQVPDVETIFNDEAVRHEVLHYRVEVRGLHRQAVAAV